MFRCALLQPSEAFDSTRAEEKNCLYAIWRRQTYVDYLKIYVTNWHNHLFYLLFQAFYPIHKDFTFFETDAI